jgi:hypothetical protein
MIESSSCRAEMPSIILCKSVTPPENTHPFPILEKGVIGRYRSQVYIQYKYEYILLAN